jgi:cytochrome c peroxidase
MKLRLRHRAALAWACGAIAMGCPRPSARPVPPAPRQPSVAPPEAPATFTESIGGSTIAWEPSQAVAYVADADNLAVHAVDPATGRVVTTPLDGRPEQLVPLGSGRLGVALRDRNEVVLLRFDKDGAGKVVSRATVATEPWGLATTARGEILVTSAWGRALTSLDGGTLRTRWSIELPREPRGVVATRDGTRAFVTHLVGDSVSVVDLAGDRPAARSVRALGAPHRNRADDAIGVGTLHRSPALAYAAAISESGTRVFVPHLIEQTGSTTPRSIPGSYGGVPIEEETSTASVAVIGARDAELVGGAPPVLASGAKRDEATHLHNKAPLVADSEVGFALPPSESPARQARAAAAFRDSLFVASLGTREVIELDARAIDPAMSVVRRIKVGEGPTGLAVDRQGHRLLAWSQISHELTTVALGTGETSTLAVGADPLEPEVAKGRRLFYTELDRRISRDGRACAACHPDGRDDGNVWKLGAGPRQTPTLVGRLETGPFGWEAKHTDLRDNMRETMGRLGGGGISTSDLTALASYLRRGLFVPNRAVEASEEVRRGRELFTSAEVGCSGCHLLDADGSDRKRHDVGSRARGDVPVKFRTAPLKFVGGTAPYFHDGRYATLEQLIELNYDAMGETSQLTDPDRHALVAFLRSL